LAIFKKNLSKFMTAFTHRDAAVREDFSIYS